MAFKPKRYVILHNSIIVVIFKGKVLSTIDDNNNIGPIEKPAILATPNILLSAHSLE